jgi:hypothetical protein
MTLFRGMWVTPNQLALLRAKEPILPEGMTSADELDSAIKEAEKNFGSLRMAALHHLTGATGVRPNENGKPLFTFWSRNKGVAVDHLRTTYGQVIGKHIAVILEAELAPNPRVIVAADQGLYTERIADNLEDTFEEFAPEDEVFVALPVTDYIYSVMNLTLSLRSPGQVTN